MCLLACRSRPSVGVGEGASCWTTWNGSAGDLTGSRRSDYSSRSLASSRPSTSSSLSASVCSCTLTIEALVSPRDDTRHERDEIVRERTWPWRALYTTSSVTMSMTPRRLPTRPDVLGGRRYTDQVERPVAEQLVGDVHLTALGVIHLRHPSTDPEAPGLLEALTCPTLRFCGPG